jgi:hypothetical protein
LVEKQKNYGAHWYIPPTEWKASVQAPDGVIPGSIPGANTSTQREEWRDMPEKFKTRAQKEEERLEREHMVKLKELKKEIAGSSGAASRAFREFLLEKGGRLPHYLVNLEDKDGARRVRGARSPESSLSKQQKTFAVKDAAKVARGREERGREERGREERARVEERASRV